MSIDKRIVFFIFFYCFISFTSHGEGKKEVHGNVLTKGISLPMEVREGDSIFLVNLREVLVYPPLEFKNKKDERHYWRTVRDVKKALPLAKIAAVELSATNSHLLTLNTDKERKAYLKSHEKELFRKHEPQLRQMTISQGKILMKLIDRECDNSSYDLIKSYRGSFSAVFWQGIARIFGSNLKTTYDLSGEEDQKIERVIKLVEAGML